MIDKQTGRITLSDCLPIKANDTFDTLVSLHLGEVQEINDMQNGWKWMTAKNIKVHDNYFNISFGFCTNSLKHVTLIVSNDRFDLTAAAFWEIWSEKAELETLLKLRNWLKKELGREGTFPWGNVSANYDRKSGSSSITIRYN